MAGTSPQSELITKHDRLSCSHPCVFLCFDDLSGNFPASARKFATTGN